MRSPRSSPSRPRPPLARRHARLGPTRLRRWRRSPVLFWAVSALLAGASAGLVHHSASRADELRRSLGETRQVPVARHQLDRGDQIAGDDVDWRDLPRGALPDGVASEVEGRTVAQPINDGEPVVESRLAPRGVSGVAALLPPGSTAIAIPLSLGAPPVEVGDQVDLLAAGQGGFELGNADRVARDGLVVAVDDEAITVAIDDDDAAATVAALTTGAVAVALVSAGP